MILQPDFITSELFEAARREVIAKGKTHCKETGPEYYDEGLSAQIMYIGAYDDGPRRSHVCTPSFKSMITSAPANIMRSIFPIYAACPRRRTAPFCASRSRKPE